MNFIVPFLVLICSVDFVFCNLWFNIFEKNAKDRKYSEDTQIEKWKIWISAGKMQLLCTDELLPGEKPEQKHFKIATDLLGNSLGARKCQINFYRDIEETLETIFELLWGFTNLGLFPDRDCVSKHMDVKIEMSQPHSYVFVMGVKQSHILIYDKKEINNLPKYVDVFRALDEKLENIAQVHFEQQPGQVSDTVLCQTQNI
jgi:hypothetical protein